MKLKEFLETEGKEAKRTLKALAAIAFMLFSAFPNFMLGWLISAIARHQEAEKAISAESVYAVLLNWQGGVFTMPLVIILMVVFALLLIISYGFKESGFGHNGDGMSQARIILRKILIPAFISFASFCGGIFSGSTLTSTLRGVFLIAIFGMFAAIIHYIADLE